MRQEKTTNVSITVEIAGKTVTFSESISKHDLTEGTAALINSVLLIESNLNE